MVFVCAESQLAWQICCSMWWNLKPWTHKCSSQSHSMCLIKGSFDRNTLSEEFSKCVSALLFQLKRNCHLKEGVLFCVCVPLRANWQSAHLTGLENNTQLSETMHYEPWEYLQNIQATSNTVLVKRQTQLTINGNDNWARLIAQQHETIWKTTAMKIQ